MSSYPYENSPWFAEHLPAMTSELRQRCRNAWDELDPQRIAGLDETGRLLAEIGRRAQFGMFSAEEVEILKEELGAALAASGQLDIEQFLEDLG